MKKPLLFSFLLSLSVAIYAQPANDLCASAINLTVNATCTNTTGQTLLNATQTGSPTPKYGTRSYDVWYTFTTPATPTPLTLQIQMSGMGANINPATPTFVQSYVNTFIEVFRATTCGAITPDNSLGVVTADQAFILSDVAPSTLYYFRVYTYEVPTASGAWGFSICVNRNIAVPGNNECINAVNIPIGGSVTGQRVSNATASTGIPAPSCGGIPDDDVWYSFTASATSHVITVQPEINLNNSGAMIQVFSGACGSMAQIACGKESVRVTGLTIGQTYRLRVYSAGTVTTGTFGGASGANFAIGIAPATTSTTNIKGGRMNEVFKQSILSGPNVLNDPWEVTYEPSTNLLWVTEAKGYKVYTFDPVTGERTTVLDLTRGSNWFSPTSPFNAQLEMNVMSGQGGFAGLAIPPDFASNHYVFVSYIYKYDSTRYNNEGLFFRNAVARFTYNTVTKRLESPMMLCDTLPGSSDHNSQRMIVAPVGGTNYLFYAAGDMGAGQFINRLRTMKAQNVLAYEGKILRFNITEDVADVGFDRWIPDTNPFNTTSPARQSAVWAIGIRNNQGFAYDPVSGKLFGSSHGPYSDDEINLLEQGMNYGHPLVIGKGADNNYNNSSAGANNGSTCPVITNETTNMNNLGATYRDAKFTGYPRTQAEINTIYVNNPGNGGWPSEGWSGMSFYGNTVIPGWKNSLVVASLKWGRVLRFKYDMVGDTIERVTRMDDKDTIGHFDSQNRFRDVAFSPDGKDLYVIMDKSPATSGPSEDNPSVVTCAGCLQKYTFLGYNDVAGKSGITGNVPIAKGTLNACNTGTPTSINTDNNLLWVPVTGPDGNIVAEIRTNGLNLGNITSSYYLHSGATRYNMGRRYLNRNITITPAVQPGADVGIRLYITGAEYAALRATAGSGVVDTSSLRILKNNDPCGSALSSAVTIIDPAVDTFGTDGYVLQATINSFSSFYIGSALSTLPVSLVSFEGKLIENKETLLQWKTNQEINTAYFSVERSIDGANYNEIGRVNAIGRDNNGADYDFTDREVSLLPVNTVYYRLRMVDNDGRFTYSKIVVITLPYVSGNITVAPNPAVHEVSVLINSGAAVKAAWKITDNAGRVVMSSTTDLKKGRNLMTIDLTRLAAGIYYLNVTGADTYENVKIQKL